MEADGDVRFIYALALRLGKTAGEVMDLPLEELRGWQAFLSRKDAPRKGG